ncbi:potassium channel family protein [Viridibacillus sp. NPDC096237]|uniref:potassium channel family protein n=1 Tax=Viridibacillus sp. NPDC096237 TaxID=3390721 RepID=UPI003CFBFC0C
MLKKSFAVFGLGRFGGTIVKEFNDMGIEIDKDEAKVNEYMNYATHAVCVNAIDETTLNLLGARNDDHTFVSFGDAIQSRILTSLLLKEIGVRKVSAKVENENHSKVLEKIAVDRFNQQERATKKLDHYSLSDLDVRANYGCTIVGIQLQGTIIISPPEEVIYKGDILIVIGHNKDIMRFEEKGVV